MFVRVCAFVIWALVAGTTVFWGLRLLVRAPDAPAHAVPVAVAMAVRGDLARLLGAAPVVTAEASANPEASSRFRLLGVMAPKAGTQPDAGVAASGQGIALIAVDGKPAKAFSVGALLDSGLVLQAVSLRTASIGPPQGAASVKLEIPPLPAPATGSLPPVAVSPAGISTPPVAPIPPAAPPAVVPALPQPVMVAPPPMQQQAKPTLPAPQPNVPGSKRDFGNTNR